MGKEKTRGDPHKAKYQAEQNQALYSLLVGCKFFPVLLVWSVFGMKAAYFLGYLPW